MPADLLDGKALAAKLQSQLATDVAQLVAARGVTPHLVAVLVGDDPASAVYVRNKHRACELAGMKTTVHRLDVATTQDELLRLVHELNADPTVHGILVQLPLPPQIKSQVVLDAVDPAKDVDCFHPENVGRLSQGRPRFLPCTPHGCLALLDAAGISLVGQHAVVVGRSDIVGKPLGLLMLQKGRDATVTICHSRTRDLGAITRTADVLFAAIGMPNFITADMVRPGAVVVDVGINRVDGKLVGDVAFEPVRQIARAITPVPGGVGPMTITMLLQNTLTAARQAAGSV